MQIFLGFLLALSVTMVLIPLLMRWAVPLHILDMPDARKRHGMPVPRVGGIAMAAGVLLALLTGGVSTPAMHALWACIAIVLVFGVWDDRKTLRAAPKFFGQAIAVLIAMIWGGIRISSLTLTERMPIPEWIGLPLTFFFLLGCTNAFNLSDGLDGLAGGMAMLCLCGTALLAYTVGTLPVGWIAIVLVGALIGFLRFNTHPARVFMGDGGSQMIGLCAALLVLMLTQDPQIPLSTALPLLLLGMPIIDTLMVMVERLLAGSSPFVADRRHIHYRLLALGFEHWEAVSILYLLQGVLFVAAWFLRYETDLTVLLAFLTFGVLVIVPLRLAQHLGLHIRSAVSGGVDGPGTSDDKEERPGTAVSARHSFQKLGHLLLGVGLAAYALWVLMTAQGLSSDVPLLALGLAAVLGFGLLLRRRATDALWSDKIALYSCAALAIFVSKRGLSVPLHGTLAMHSHLIEYGLCALLATAIVICIRSSGARPFRVTPLDILVVLIVATVPNLPDSIASTSSLGVTVAELVLLFYALEALALAVGQRWRWLNGAVAVFLLGLALRTSF
jgi:UDP-GlcNAc:undecaprenyl-phosphate GlcNAc-1-phosphate transferase